MLSPPVPTPVHHVSQSRKDRKTPFHACLCEVVSPSRDSFSASSVFPRRRIMVWDAPIQICAPLLLPARGQWNFRTLFSSPQPSAPLCPLTNSLSQAVVLPTVTQMVVHNPKVTGSPGILTSWSPCQALPGLSVEVKVVLTELFGILDSSRAGYLPRDTVGAEDMQVRFTREEDI